jgi:predicted XRE-type DNA-binding protein
MGLAQSEVSDLVRGRLAGVTLERLVRCLIRVGMQIGITVAPPRNADTRPGTVVKYAYD